VRRRTGRPPEIVELAATYEIADALVAHGLRFLPTMVQEIGGLWWVIPWGPDEHVPDAVARATKTGRHLGAFNDKLKAEMRSAAINSRIFR
jgi:hypothetical protein